LLSAIACATASSFSAPSVTAQTKVPFIAPSFVGPQRQIRETSARGLSGQDLISRAA
jgi:hypothetical protein